LQNKRPQLVGSSVFGMLDVYARFLPFVRAFRQSAGATATAAASAGSAAGAGAGSGSGSNGGFGLEPGLGLGPAPPASLQSSFAAGSGEMRPLYAVCVDVRHCFDTMDRDKLMQLLQSSLTEVRHCVRCPERGWSLSMAV
jgi:hypothetical protein